MPRKKTSIKSNAKKENNKKILALAALVIIVIVILSVFYMPQGSSTYPSTNQGQSSQQSSTGTIAEAGDVCKANSECFLTSCKNTPNNSECVNATHEELFYKDCGNNWNNVVPATQNVQKCSCDQGICKVK